MAYTNLPDNPSGGHPQGQRGWDNAARAANYQDMYKDIEAMRQDAFAREKARGEFPSEFSGLPDTFLSFWQGGSLNRVLTLSLISAAGYWLAKKWRIV